MARSYVRGGAKLRKFLRNAAKSSRAPQAGAEAGFVEPHIAGLAARLEFGDPRTDLPERPAFRASRIPAGKAGAEIVRKALSARVTEGVFIVDEAHAKAAAEAMAETIKDSYRTFHGPGLSERQAERKRGTPGAGRELVGHRGERLIGHIKGRVEE